MKVGIFGVGAYGLALSSVMTDNIIDITMWTKFEEEKDDLEKNRKNDKLLPGYILSSNIKLTTSIEECMKDKDLLVIVIPVAFINELCIEIKKYIKDNQHICIASKGIEQNTGLFTHQIIKKQIDTNKISVISGPSFAKDVINKKPIGLSLATNNDKTKKVVEKCFRSEYLKLEYSEDIVGVEISGAVKNIMAIASGMLDGLGTNDSTKAMFITEALHDIKEIIKSLGGKEETILTFAGCGDLLLTCTSEKSRNYTFGQLVGKKASNSEIQEYLKNTTVEGYYTLKSVYQLLKSKNISVKTIDLIYNIINNNDDVENLIKFLVEKN